MVTVLLYLIFILLNYYYHYIIFSFNCDAHLNISVWNLHNLHCMGKTSHKLQRILKTVNIEVRHRSSNKLHSSLHTHKDRKHKNTQPGVYKIPCECGKVYIGETGRSFNTRIKEYKTCQRLEDKSAIVKHAQQQQHKINWEDSSLTTSIPQILRNQRPVFIFNSVSNSV